MLLYMATSAPDCVNRSESVSSEGLGTSIIISSTAATTQNQRERPVQFDGNHTDTSNTEVRYEGSSKCDVKGRLSLSESGVNNYCRRVDLATKKPDVRPKTWRKKVSESSNHDPLDTCISSTAQAPKVGTNRSDLKSSRPGRLPYTGIDSECTGSSQIDYDEDHANQLRDTTMLLSSRLVREHKLRQAPLVGGNNDMHYTHHNRSRSERLLNDDEVTKSSATYETGDADSSLEHSARIPRYRRKLLPKAVRQKPFIVKRDNVQFDSMVKTLSNPNLASTDDDNSLQMIPSNHDRYLAKENYLGPHDNVQYGESERVSQPYSRLEEISRRFQNNKLRRSQSESRIRTPGTRTRSVDSRTRTPLSDTTFDLAQKCSEYRYCDDRFKYGEAVATGNGESSRTPVRRLSTSRARTIKTDFCDFSTRDSCEGDIIGKNTRRQIRRRGSESSGYHSSSDKPVYGDESARSERIAFKQFVRMKLSHFSDSNLPSVIINSCSSDNRNIESNQPITSEAISSQAEELANELSQLSEETKRLTSGSKSKLPTPQNARTKTRSGNRAIKKSDSRCRANETPPKIVELDNIEDKSKVSDLSSTSSDSSYQSHESNGSTGSRVVVRHCRVGSSVAFGVVQISNNIPNGNGYAEGQGLVTIKMKPDDHGRFGFNVKGGADQGMPIIVSRVAPNTPADLAVPRLNEGDQVLLINGRDVSQHTHEQVVMFIRASRETHSGELVLVVRPNVYVGEDPMEEHDFMYIPETHQITSSAGANALESSLILLQESLESGAAIAQFEQLYRKKPGLTLNAARQDCNIAKNRYRDISPYDQSRVALKTGDSGDYINGNYVNMEIPNSGVVNQYIAAQGPLPNTCADFWQMVWEQQCSLIVMLTTKVERGRVKCHQYWPELYETADFGQSTITCVKEEETPSFAFREFNVSYVGSTEERHISHMQYIAWPDHGVPDDPSDFLDFVMKVRERRIGMVEPTVVHCSAGIGRTGVLITMETAMCLIEANQPVYTLQLVRQMRDQRAMLIQTSSQYKFVCEAILRVYHEGLVKPLEEYDKR